jgi:hypothetical protein
MLLCLPLEYDASLKLHCVAYFFAESQLPRARRNEKEIDFYQMYANTSHIITPSHP